MNNIVQPIPGQAYWILWYGDPVKVIAESKFENLDAWRVKAVSRFHEHVKVGHDFWVKELDATQEAIEEASLNLKIYERRIRELWEEE